MPRFTRDRHEIRIVFNDRRPLKFARRQSVIAYGAATLVVGLAIGVSLVMQRLPHANLSMVFLSAVLIVAARWGLRPSIYAGILSFLAFNFLFTPPFYTLKVAQEGDVATLVFFLFMAALAGNLAARAQREMANNTAALKRISNLYEFSRRMVAAAHTKTVLGALCEHLASTLECGVVAFLTDPAGRPGAEATSTERFVPGAVDRSLLAARWREGQREGVGDRWTLLALATGRMDIGLVAAERAQLDEDQRDLARTLCEQAAGTIERILLVRDLDEANVATETERLRSALLASVSHDLRTPLASVIGSATSLAEYGENMSPKNRNALLGTVLEESERLDRYIQNLLDMTRLGQGGFLIVRDWVDLNDLISDAQHRLRTLFAHINLEVDIAPDARLLLVHGVLIEQAMINLLENAARYTPPGGTVTVRAARAPEGTLIQVIDEGPGIPEEDRERVFDLFNTGSPGDRRPKGSGLGLAICKGLVGAHGGDVVALPGPDGIGTEMRIVLPLPEENAAGALSDE